jgi:hypothetical protein
MTVAPNSTPSGQPDNAPASSSTLIAPPTDAGTPAPDGGAVDGHQQAPAGQPEGEKPAEKPADSTPPEGQKPADGKSEGEKSEGEKPDAAKVPDQYEEFTAPEGAKLDADVIGEFKGLAKELGLTQEAAQKVVDLGPKLLEKWQAQQSQQAVEASAKWAEETRKDSEIGSDENLAIAQKALTEFGSEELKTLLNGSGLGNHKEVIRAFYRVGKAISEDGFVNGQRGPQQTVNLYPNSKMNP